MSLSPEEDLRDSTPEPLRALVVEPCAVARIWGGRTFSTPDRTNGELWLIGEDSRIERGNWAGVQLADVAAARDDGVLGRAVVEAYGGRWPLLIKIIDSAEWLSIQVHPTDAWAAELEGPDHWGKTEAWYVIEAAADAEVIAGLTAAMTEADFKASLRDGSIRDRVRRVKLRAGDAMLLEAGTLHALGPGALIYEVQQQSTITYRAYDWERPREAGRELHVDQSVRVTNRAAAPAVRHIECPGNDAITDVVESAYFDLDLLCPAEHSVPIDTKGHCFHAVTVVEGDIELHGSGWSESLGLFESAIIPAGAGVYTIRGIPAARVLISKPR
jgi:mannose-6-phosphate isomerase